VLSTYNPHSSIGIKNSDLKTMNLSTIKQEKTVELYIWMEPDGSISTQTNLSRTLPREEVLFHTFARFY